MALADNPSTRSTPPRTCRRSRVPLQQPMAGDLGARLRHPHTRPPQLGWTELAKALVGTMLVKLGQGRRAQLAIFTAAWTRRVYGGRLSSLPMCRAPMGGSSPPCSWAAGAPSTPRESAVGRGRRPRLAGSRPSPCTTARCNMASMHKGSSAQARIRRLVQVGRPLIPLRKAAWTGQARCSRPHTSRCSRPPVLGDLGQPQPPPPRSITQPQLPSPGGKWRWRNWMQCWAAGPAGPAIGEPMAVFPRCTVRVGPAQRTHTARVQSRRHQDWGRQLGQGGTTRPGAQREIKPHRGRRTSCLRSRRGGKAGGTARGRPRCQQVASELRLVLPPAPMALHPRPPSHPGHSHSLSAKRRRLLSPRPNQHSHKRASRPGALPGPPGAPRHLRRPQQAGLAGPPPQAQAQEQQLLRRRRALRAANASDSGLRPHPARSLQGRPRTAHPPAMDPA